MRSVESLFPYLDVSRPIEQQQYATLIICNYFYYNDEKISLSESAISTMVNFMN